jgi:hypothetical protein
MVSVDRLSVENGLYAIQRRIIDKYGYSQSVEDIYPLNWYIGTGRASVEFLRLLLTAKPFMIARKLHEGGSVQEVVDRIRTYLGY